ncbi:hypothetical protein ACFUIU_31500, partial [Streptomyces sp. NPDC057244]
MRTEGRVVAGSAGQELVRAAAGASLVVVGRRARRSAAWRTPSCATAAPRWPSSPTADAHGAEGRRIHVGPGPEGVA